MGNRDNNTIRSYKSGYYWGIRARYYPTIDVDKSSFYPNRIYIAYHSGESTDVDVFSIYSDDGGGQWSSPVQVNDDKSQGTYNENSQWFPWITVNKEGIVNIVFYDNRNGTSTTNVQTFVCASFDGGETYVNTAVTDLFTLSPIPGLATGYAGDYLAITYGNISASASWMQIASENAYDILSSSQVTGKLINQIASQNAGGTFSLNGTTVNSNANLDLLAGAGIFEKTLGKDASNRDRFPNYQGGATRKHNNWNDNSENFLLRNNYSVPFTTSTQTEYANFISLNPVTVTNSLEGTTSSGGYLKFNDPWYLNSDGTQGNNFGSPVAVPLTESNGISGAYNQSSGGVFLNQSGPSSNWAPPYYSVQAISPQDINLGGSIGTRRFWFQKWDGNNVQYEDDDALETGIVFTDEGAEAQAIFKGHLLSNEANGLSSNSQRKLVRDDYSGGHYHAVYTSLGQVWYTHTTSSNFGGTWTDDEALFEGYETTNPSIDVSDNNVAIVFEATDGQDAVIYLWESPGQYTEVGTIDLNYYGNAYPVVSRTPNQIFIIYKPSATQPLKYRRYYYYTGQWNHYDANLPHSTSSSKNPTIYGYKPYDDVRIAWQEGNTKIKYLNLHWHNQIMDEADYREPSSGDGYTYNYSPSIISASDGARIVWVGKRSGGGGPSKVNNGQGIDVIGNEYRVVFKSPTYYRFWMFGSDVNSPNFNKSDNHTGYVFGWSEPSGGSHVNKFADQTLSTIKTIPDVHGRDIQISNGPGKSYMYSIILNTNQSPYDLEKSQSFGSIQKVNAGLVISSGREGVVYKGDSQFYFTIGDVMVNKKHINFVEIPDTLAIDSKEVLNDCLVTEPFSLNNNSNFTYDVQYGISDSAATVNSLGDNDLINFKVQLIDAGTGEVLGLFDDITYTKENIFQYNNVSYQVNTNGIGNRAVKLRLSVDDNLSANYSLSTKYADGSLLLKSHKKEIGYQGLSTVESYDISQNYPNPFNPSTTIKYQIPEDGMVTLKVYDILGREIKTLVNEQKATGRYEVKFDASDLATGVYIYRLKVNDFVSVKKMVLVK